MNFAFKKIAKVYVSWGFFLNPIILIKIDDGGINKFCENEDFKKNQHHLKIEPLIIMQFRSSPLILE